jgi:hypothetical protein
VPTMKTNNAAKNWTRSHPKGGEAFAEGATRFVGSSDTVAALR